jgi:DNA-binding response OmpR family regulator
MGSSATLVGLRVLVVEDMLLVAEVICDALAREGCTVMGPLARMEHALTIAQDTPIDCAVLDINLAGQASFPVAAVLAARGVPFIFVTGYDIGSNLPPDYREAPCLAKPFHARELVALLRDHCASCHPQSSP